MNPGDEAVHALSTEQFLGLRPPVTWAGFRLDGPALSDEARVPVEGYYG